MRLLIPLLLLLTGCQMQHNYNYFMLHPENARDAYYSCQVTPLIGYSAKECDAAKLAFQDLDEIMTKIIPHQQDFGANIIAAQMQLAALQITVQAAQKNLADIHKQNDPMQVKTAQQQLVEAQTNYAKQAETVSHMLKLVSYLERLAGGP